MENETLTVLLLQNCVTAKQSATVFVLKNFLLQKLQTSFKNSTKTF